MEMYSERNGSGVFVNLIHHGSETYLQKYHGLEIGFTFFCLAMFQSFFSAEHLQVMIERPAECMQVFIQSVCPCFYNLNKFGMSRRILMKITYIRFNENTFSSTLYKYFKNVQVSN